jgi:hypothetical protein
VGWVKDEEWNEVERVAPRALPVRVPEAVRTARMASDAFRKRAAERAFHRYGATDTLAMAVKSPTGASAS